MISRDDIAEACHRAANRITRRPAADQDALIRIADGHRRGNVGADGIGGDHITRCPCAGDVDAR